MLCLALCFTHTKDVLHALADNGTVKARGEPRMDRLHARSVTCNVIACEQNKLHSSVLHMHIARHKDQMHAMDCVLVRNSRVPLQISQETTNTRL